LSWKGPLGGTRAGGFVGEARSLEADRQSRWALLEHLNFRFANNWKAPLLMRFFDAAV